MSMCRRSLSMLVVAAVLVCVPGAIAATHTVLVGNGGANFNPAAVTVAPGDTIEWVHVAGSHTVTSGTPCTSDGRFNDPVPPGGSVVWVVPTNEPAGVIPYFCIPHCNFGMTGTINVEIPIQVPTVSEWGLGAMTLVLLAVGTLMLRRRVGAMAG